jgi:hypothetical protein
MKSLFKKTRLLLTIALAGLIAWALWHRLKPRWESPPAWAVNAKPFDAAFIRLTPAEIAALPEAVRFDHPMGSPNAAMTYNAQPFRITRHLGDDLNGIGGENSDLGDPVFASGAGRVVYCGVPGKGWGNMVILAHRVPDAAGESRVMQSVYAHLQDMLVRPNQIVRRGEQIGTVGTAGGIYLAHLHFEVREGPYVNPSVGYADVPLNRVSPERFIAEHRGASDDQLNPAPPFRIVEVNVEAEP